VSPPHLPRLLVVIPAYAPRKQESMRRCGIHGAPMDAC
jgi:hypothetical protein